MTDNKAALIREMLDDGLSPKEIKAELKSDGVEVTSQYIYNVKRRWKEGQTEEDSSEDQKAKDKPEEDEEDNEGDYFTRLPREKRHEVETEEYECGNCGFAWRAPRNKYQACCPECGVDFE